MIPDLIYKLTRVLEQPVTTECELVYVMVEIRKLMDWRLWERRQELPEADRQKLKPEFPVLTLFCDWTVHISIDRNRNAGPLLLAFDEAAESVREGKGYPLAFLQFLSLSNFRQEFARFLTANELPKRLVEDQNAWDTFLDLYSAVVSDCPVFYTGSGIPLKLVARITLTKELPPDDEDSWLRSILRPEPYSVWMNWRVELTDDTVLNWPFYN